MIRNAGSWNPVRFGNMSLLNGMRNMMIEGTAVVSGSDGQSYAFTRGDLVTFRPNMSCVWKVLEKIRKHYLFDMDTDEHSASS